MSNASGKRGKGPSGGGNRDNKSPPKDGKTDENKEETTTSEHSSEAGSLTNLIDVGLTQTGPQKIMTWAQKGEWQATEQMCKTLERAMAAGRVEPNLLANVVDPNNGMSPLMYAVKDNRISLIDRLIDLGCDVTARNKDNYSVLQLAAMHSREDVVKLLLSKRKVDPKATGGAQQETAIHMVASRSTAIATSVMKDLLVAAGPDIRVKPDVNGKIPLLIAVESGNQSMTKELLNLRADEQLKAKLQNGDTAVHLAAKRKDVDLVQILVENGAKVDVKNAEGQTPLHLACSLGDDATVKFLVGKANPNITDSQERTAMYLAAANGHANIIEILSDKYKASVLERSKDGSTLIHIASAHGHADCALMLFKKGVYLHMPNKFGIRSIHTAAKNGHVGIINALLHKGENVDVTTNDNYTALHIAVEAAKAMVVETLLGHGAKVQYTAGSNRETPLHIASRVRNGEKCALMLLKSGADANARTEDGNTPVHIAAEHGNLMSLLLLLDENGNPLGKNQKGETALHLACANCRLNIVQHLLTFVKEKQGAEQVNKYVNFQTVEGCSALHYACKIEKSQVKKTGNDKEIVRLLFEHGIDWNLATKDTNETAFHYVAKVANEDIFLEMMSNVPQGDHGKILNRQTSIGWSPLLIASHHGHMDIVNNLLNYNARVDVFDIEGRSALHLAAERGFQNVCDALLKHKAFINSRSRIGRTSLHLAAMNGYTDLVRFLVTIHKATVDILTLQKETPLHLAAAAGQIEVCKLLLDLGANINAADDQGKRPIHEAAQNNFSDVVNLFLREDPTLVMAVTKEGNSSAHIASLQGYVKVIEVLLEYDREGVISARNKTSDSTALQLAALGGHAETVKVLIAAGASCVDENKSGFTAVHLAAQNGHWQVLEEMRNSNALKTSNRKLGMTALHVASYFGQVDTARELLTDIPGTVKSLPPHGASLVSSLGSESGLTPLHLASYSGYENVTRLLLNSPGVTVEAATNENAYNSLHMACFGGHLSVVGLLLSRSSDVLQSVDKHGQTGLHIAATHNQIQMVEVLLGQGAEINATDRQGFTALHCAAKAGCYEIVKLLCESGAAPKMETKQGCSALWFSVAENHYDVFEYLLHREHDTYALIGDRRFVYNLMACSKSHNHKPIEEFVLVSPAALDTAAKLSCTFITLATKEKERAKDLIAAGRQCQTMAVELMVLATGGNSAAKILESVDRRHVEFLDVLIENEQKEVIAHTVVQKYLQEVWKGALGWPAPKILLLFFTFVFVPPVWVYFTLPFGHDYHKVPIIKFMSYLTSHVFLMLFLMMSAITPIYPTVRASLFPYWYEWILLVWYSGLLLYELTNPSDTSGLGWIKLAVLLLGIAGVATHVVGISFVTRYYWPTLMFWRNQFLAMSFLFASVQILDILSFHHLFGPWAIIIGELMVDLTRFLAVLAIFIFGFSMYFVALNQPFHDMTTQEIKTYYLSKHRQHLRFEDVILNPLIAFELLFFAVFGQATPDQLTKTPPTPLGPRAPFADNMLKIVYAVYMLVSVVVLINLLIAMMSDTYHRIQQQSDIEWKFGLSKLIRSMHRTTAAPAPVNLIATWLVFFVTYFHKKIRPQKKPNLAQVMAGFDRRQFSARTKAAVKWLGKINRELKGGNAPKEAIIRMSPIKSQISFSNLAIRIEDVAEWETIAQKYKILVGELADTPQKADDEEDEEEAGY